MSQIGNLVRFCNFVTVVGKVLAAMTTDLLRTAQKPNDQPTTNILHTMVLQDTYAMSCLGVTNCTKAITNHCCLRQYTLKLQGPRRYFESGGAKTLFSQ